MRGAPIIFEFSTTTNWFQDHSKKSTESILKAWRYIVTEGETMEARVEDLRMSVKVMKYRQN